MGWKQKYIYGEAGVRHLVIGLVLIFFAIALILVLYGVLYGRVYGYQQGVYIKPEDRFLFVSFIFYVNLGILALGSFGGIEIGRYVQTEFAKRRKHTS